MSTFYEILYFLRFAPWERDNAAASKLRAFLDAPDAPARGRALDLGCGYGRNSLLLAERGWNVTGVDSVERALKVAEKRSSKRSLSVRWVRADVTQLGAVGLDAPYDLLLDFGCFHGMSDRERARYGASLTAVSGPRSRLLLFAFGRKTRRGPGPRGASREDVERAFSADWEITREENDESAMRPPGNPSSHWYLLVRR